MADEKDAIKRIWVKRPGVAFSQNVKIVDFSMLEIGDWFKIGGSSELGFVRRQIRNDEAANGMRFTIEKTAPYRWRAVRTS